MSTSSDALVEAVRSSLVEVLVLGLAPTGELRIISGPEMSLEHVNWLLDKAKSALHAAPIIQSQPSLSLVSDG